MAEVPPPLPRRRRIWAYVLVALIALTVAAAGLWWWQNRPIEPVNLTAAEREVVEEKVAAIQEPEPRYEPGSKEIILTERELNGLLHQNTSLGETLRFELARGAVHARLETDLDPELPVVGGKRLKARARFLVDAAAGQPALVLDDLTVWGISLPNDWLGGIKGQNLLADAFGTSGGLAGVESLVVERGRLVIRLAE